MAKTNVPIEWIAIRIVNTSDHPVNESGTLAIQRWDKKQRFQRAIRMSAKLIGCVMGMCLTALLIHPLIIPSLITLLLTLLALPIIFSYFLGQQATFLYANAQCPHCLYQGQLKRYLTDTVSDVFTLLCQKCGQSCRGQLIDSMPNNQSLS